MAGGVLYVDDLSRCTGLQQKNLWFACERLDKYNLRLVVCAGQTLDTFLGQGWDEQTRHVQDAQAHPEPARGESTRSRQEGSPPFRA